MAFDGTLKFDTSIDQSGFESGLSKIGTIAKKGMKAFAGAVTAASGTLVKLGKDAVNVGKGFESSMAQVIATMGISKDTIEDGVNSYELLKKAASDAGATTTFSASEAADALNYLALAGYSAGQAADALPSVLNLAAAGGLDLAYASDLATDAMAALGIEATKDNLTHFGDEMAKTASKANTSVAQLGEAILTVGGTAKSLAGGTVELNAALGVLANRGIKGSEGGTALRNMILSLSAPTEKAAKQLKGLGVEVFDSAGKMRPLNEVFKDLDKSLSTMTEGEKTQVLNSIFNKVDLKSAQAMLAGCGDEFDALTAELLSCDGAMSQMGETMNDTLEGDMKSLASKAEALGITVYDKLNTPLRELAKLGGEYLSQLTSAFDEGGFEGLAGSLGDVLAKAVTIIAGYIPKVTELAVSVIRSFVTGLSTNKDEIFKAAIEAVSGLVDGFLSITQDIVWLGGHLIISLCEGLSQNAGSLVGTITTGLVEIVDTIMAFAPSIADAGITLIFALVKGVLDTLPELTSGVINLLRTSLPEMLSEISGIVTAIAESLPDMIMQIVDLIPELIDSIVAGLGEALPAIIECSMDVVYSLIEIFPDMVNSIVLALPSLIDGIIAGLLDLLPMIVDCGVQLFVSLVQALPDAIYAIVAVLPTIIAAIVSTLIGMAPLMIECGIELLTSLISALPQIIITIVAVIPQIIASIISALIDSIPLLIQAGIDLFVALIAALPDIIVAIVAAIPKIIASLVSAIISNGPRIAVAGVQLLVSLIKSLPQITATIVKAIPQIVTGIITAITSFQSKIRETGANLIKGLWNGISDTASWLWNKISGMFTGLTDRIKKFFGIASPSKLMRDQVGKFLAEGIGVGFAEEMPQVGKDAAKLVDAMKLPRPKIGIDIDGTDWNGSIKVDSEAVSALSAYSSGMLGDVIHPSATSDVVSNSIANNTSTTNNYNQTLTFNQPIRTPSQVARAARKALEVK